jgi:hypothetical protein
VEGEDGARLARVAPMDEPNRVIENGWGALYKVGAAAAVVVLALVPLQMVVFIARPPPSRVVDWFALFHESRLMGLVDMDVLLIVNNVCIGLMFLAVCVALRRTRPALVAIAITLEVIAISTYFASNTAFQMLSLSDRYAVATSDSERLMLVAAGEAMVATWQGSAFAVSYVLGAVAFLVMSAVMLRSRVFSRTTAYVGLVFGALSLVPASAGRVGLAMSLASLVPMLLWIVLIAWTLFRLARAKPTAAEERSMDVTRAHQHA